MTISSTLKVIEEATDLWVKEYLKIKNSRPPKDRLKYLEKIAKLSQYLTNLGMGWGSWVALQVHSNPTEKELSIIYENLLSATIDLMNFTIKDAKMRLKRASKLQATEFPKSELQPGVV